MKKKWTEQVIFITDPEVLAEVKSQVEKGRTLIYTKLERKILKDMQEEKEQGIEDREIREMKRTSKFLRFGNMFKSYLGLFIEMLVSHSEMVCYFFMIISMMKNAGFISLIYPFTVFGYALMEELKPRKKFWYFILLYTEALILLKFLF
jgi:hypothetical protein